MKVCDGTTTITNFSLAAIYGDVKLLVNEQLGEENTQTQYPYRGGPWPGNTWISEYKSDTPGAGLESLVIRPYSAIYQSAPRVYLITVASGTEYTAGFSLQVDDGIVPIKYYELSPKIYHAMSG